jgi:hypothetical protein
MLYADIGGAAYDGIFAYIAANSSRFFSSSAAAFFLAASASFYSFCFFFFSAYYCFFLDFPPKICSGVATSEYSRS